MEEKQQRPDNHKLTVDGRKRATITGVKDVISFDAKEIVLETELGGLTIKGDELHVNRLTLERGEVDVDGKMDGFQYSDKGSANGGDDSFLKRLFR